MQYIFRLIRFLTLNYKPFRKKNELLTVLFHQVNDNPFTFYPAVPTKVYQETCLFLAKHYEIIHFSEVEQYYQTNPTKPATIITFDDGTICDTKDEYIDKKFEFAVLGYDHSFPIYLKKNKKI